MRAACVLFLLSRRIIRAGMCKTERRRIAPGPDSASLGRGHESEVIPEQPTPYFIRVKEGARARRGSGGLRHRGRTMATSTNAVQEGIDMAQKQKMASVRRVLMPESPHGKRILRIGRVLKLQYVLRTKCILEARCIVQARCVVQARCMVEA